MHRAVLDDQGYDYRFGNAFFRHSTFKVFEMQGHYEHYQAYPRDVVKARFKLQKEVEGSAASGREARLHRHRVCHRSTGRVRWIGRASLHPLLLPTGLGFRAGDVALCRGRL